MDRRLFMAGVALSVAGVMSARSIFAASGQAEGDFPKISKTEAEWRELLDEQQYAVLFDEATERPWSSDLNKEKRDGTYLCAACYLPLFHSETKFDRLTTVTSPFSFV